MEETNHPKVKILVACHKDDPNIRQDNIYMPIQVGKALHPELDLGFQCDNTGDNISEKNGSYCELTALYWAWKNLRNVDYIGLCHYRRYFDFSNPSFIEILPQRYWNPPKNEKSLMLSMLREDCIITSKHNVYPYSTAIDYAVGHNGEDLRVVQEIIREKFPLYELSFENAIIKKNSSAPYNMFIMPWKIFNDYCSFLFPLLEETNLRTSTITYRPYQKRLLGFIAERIMNVFVDYKIRNGFKQKNLPVVWLIDSDIHRSKIHYLLNKVRYNISFFIAKSSHPKF